MAYLSGTNRNVETGDTYFKELKNSQGTRQINFRRVLRRRELSNLTLDARIEYARFIVDCPNCRNAEFAFEDSLFWCSSCNNSNIQGKLYNVKMPEKRKEIEDILGKRNIVNRHWTKETLQELAEENELNLSK